MEPIRLTEEQLRKLQLEMLSILVEFDRICKKHGIRYFLSGGTLLGAVRHKGFIPWDDDVDVEMLREEYERFCCVCSHELEHSVFFFQDWHTDEHYCWTYGKLRKKETAYVRVGQEHLRQKTGICIDIFALDAMKNQPFPLRVCEVMTRVCRKVLWARVGFKLEHVRWKKVLYSFLRYVPRTWTLTLFECVTQAFQSEKDVTFLVFTGTDSRSERGYLQQFEWFAKSVEVEFEGKMFPAPIGYDQVLRFWYGDYWKYPPKEERIPHTTASYIRFSDHTELKGDASNE